MKISIFGMGYVGTTSAACLMEEGHSIIGVDIDPAKVDKLSKGESPMMKEVGVDDLLEAGHRKELLKATTDPLEAVKDCDMVWICVGTPSKFDGSIDCSSLLTVVRDVSKALKQTDNRPLIVIRSTCLPGTTEELAHLFWTHSNIMINTRKSDKGKGGIDMVFHPEFLREGTAIEDFKNASRIVVGELYEGAADLLLTIYYSGCDNVYNGYVAQCFRLNFKEAEMVKYCDNIFHALKITFANEVASISNALKIDSRKVAEVYCADTKLNISPAYLLPGFAYGGSCLPKDLRAILRFASTNYVQVPMLQNIEESNRIQIDNLTARILKYEPETVGMVGISFKDETDDIRESPYVKVAKSLIGEGVNLLIYDNKLANKDDLIGSNKKYYQKMFRNIEDLLVPSLDDLSSADLIVVNHFIFSGGQIRDWLNSGIRIIDLVGFKDFDNSIHNYEGIYW